MLYKNELLKISPMPLDDFKKIKGSKYDAIVYEVKNKKCGNVLIADIYSRSKTNDIPKYRFFTDNKNFQIYTVNENKWSTKALRSHIGADFYSGTDISASEASIKLLKKIVKSWSWQDYALPLIDSFISKYHAEQTAKARAQKEMRIEETMDLFPELPKKLNDWLKKSVFKKYIFISKLIKGKRNATCGFCGKRYTVSKDIKHRVITECPKCRHKATAIMEHHHSAIDDKAKICVTYKVDGQLLIRWLKVSMQFFDDFKPRFTHEHDYFRAAYLIKNNKPDIKFFDYKKVFGYGKYWREQKYKNKDLTYVYPDNLIEVFGEKYYNVNLSQELTKTNQPVKLIPLLDNLKNLPSTEYLVKMGLTRLAAEIYQESLCDGRDFTSILGVSKQYLPLYKKYNVSMREHLIIKASKTWVSFEDFEKLRNINADSESLGEASNILEHTSFTKFVNYFAKQRLYHRDTPFNQMLIWYRDYMVMANALNVDISHKSVKYPKNIKVAHDRLTTQFKAIQIEFEDANFKIAMENLYNGLSEYKNAKYAVILPKSKSDFITEGNSLSHCVGSSSIYYTNHCEGSKMIFFIRKTTDIKTPFVTMQIDMKRLIILQIYGYANKRPEQSVINFANSYLKLLSKNDNERSAS